MKKGVVILLVLVMFMQMSQASFIYKNNTLGNIQNSGGSISGVINISFQNQTANARFTSNFGGNISLIKLLENSGYVLGDEYSCSTNNCSMGYVAGDLVSSLMVNGNSYVGFKIPGRGVSKIGVASEANSIRLDVKSDIGPFCYNQLLIDVGANNERYIFNNKTTGNICTSSKDYGCFNSELGEGSYSDSIIGTTRYCENISLSAAPAYSLGARISKRTNGGNNATLNMSLYSFSGEKLRSCALDNLTEDAQELECSVYYGLPTRRDLLVCVSASVENSIYQIRVESQGKVCGTNSNSLNNLNLADSEVFARPLESDALDISINNNIFNGRYSGTLGEYMFNYLRDNYPADSSSKVNCAEGCIIPIGLYGSNQNVSLSNVEVRYFNDAAPGGAISSSTYILTRGSGKISSNYVNLDLSSANFAIPYNQNVNKFILYLDGEKVFEKSIDVTPGFTFEMSPLNVLIGQRVELVAGNSSINVNSSIWNFGNGEIVNSAGDRASHVFTSLGNSDVEVTLIRKDGTRAVRKFTVESRGANESAWIILNKYEQSITTLSNQILAYPSWISQDLNKKVDVLGINATTVQLKKSLGEAVGDEALVGIIKKLLAIEVPTSLGKSKSGSFVISVGYNNIDPNGIKDLSESANANISEEITAGIIQWMNDNYKGVIDFESIDAYAENGKISPILTKYKITLSPSEDANIGEEVYLIINYPLDGIKFMQDYGQKKIGSATYIALDGTNQVFEFSLPSFVQVKDLGVYVSPPINKLALSEEILAAEKPHFNWKRFILWTGIITLMTLLIYILLQEWYKYRYESYLFRQRNDLYNIITFIFNSRNNKLNDNEIRKKLSGAGWKGEQIIYAFKKIDGKRTGMFEIPLLRPFEKKKIRNEIAKRQIPNSVNFIKGPRL